MSSVAISLLEDIRLFQGHTFKEYFFFVLALYNQELLMVVLLTNLVASLVAQTVKNLSAMWET